MLSARLSHTLLFTLLLLIASQVPVAHSNTAIHKSPSDDRFYRALTLENGLQVLLVYDKTADKAAVSMDIATGSAANPKNRAGLAHFLEHMLFLGTKKYPEAGEYQAFIQAHGGNHNAFTALQNTNYFFDINADDLEPALDRFSQFFIAPLFHEEYTDRERHAVHSEYSAKLRDDSRRAYAAHQQVMNPQHPGSRFAVGNLTTLSNDKNGSLRTDLIDFYQAQYSANRMKLVILSKQPLDQLASYATHYFSAIPNHHLPPLKITQPQFKQLPKKLEVKTLKESRTLSLTFPTPAILPLWQSNPLGLISSLTGYEGEGSLLALLKQQGLATALGASGGQEYAGENSFNVSIDLTPAGLEQQDEVIRLFFAFINTLKKQGIPQAIIQEEQRLNAQAFEFLPKQAAIHYVVTLSNTMQHYPTEHWLDAAYQQALPQHNELAPFLAAITPSNMLITLESDQVTGNQTAPDYNTAYRLSTPGPRQLQQWQNAVKHSDLHLRQPNPYIAEDTRLKTVAESIAKRPQQIVKSPGTATWHQQDTEYKTPKTDLFIGLFSPLALSGAKADVSLNLWAGMVSEQLNKPLYDAAMAGHKVSVYPHARGLTINISGYSDKTALLAEQVSRALRQPEDNPERFARILRTYQEGLNNSYKDKPYDQLLRTAFETLLQRPTLEAKIEAAAHYTQTDLNQFINTFMADANVRMLVHGNSTEKDASALSSQITQTLLPRKSRSQVPELTIRKLKANTPVTLKRALEHQDSAAIIYLQGSTQDAATRARVALINEIISAPFYTRLRTEKQLGYIVYAAPLNLEKTPGIALVVQSPKYAADALVNEMQSFLNTFAAEIDNLTPEALNGYKRSLISRIMDKEDTLQRRSRRLWNELNQGDTQFDSREAVAEAASTITLDQLQNTYKALLSRQLILSSTGTQPHPASGDGVKEKRSIKESGSENSRTKKDTDQPATDTAKKT